MKKIDYSKRTKALAFASVSLTLGISCSAIAADPTPSAKTMSDQGDQIGVVVVTAQRREQRVQDVPISVQVFSELELAEHNLTTLTDLTQTAPSVHVDQAGGRSSSLYIRGIGSGNSFNFDQSVGMFIDDIYHGRSRTSAATFLDPSRIEVLKGPQSTYFGNNAIAGAFNIVSNKPTDQFDASARLVYSPQGRGYGVEAAAGGPVGTTTAYRVAFIDSGMSGWLRNVNLGTELPKQDNKAARLTLLLKPTADLDATFKVEGGSDSGVRPLQIVSCPPPPPLKSPSTCVTALNLGLPVGLGSNANAESAGQEQKIDTNESVLTLNYRQWGHTFTSVTGYYGYRFFLNQDADAIPADVLNAQAKERYRQYSQEFRIASPANQPIEYLAGLYFQTDKLDLNSPLTIFSLSPVVRSTPALSPLIPYLPLAQSTNFIQNERSDALFGSMTWNATDRLKLTAGLRGTWVKKDLDQNLYSATGTLNFGGVVPLPASVAPLANGLSGPSIARSLARTDSAWLPSAKLQYKIDQASMVYASYAKGFKAGGFNAASAGATATLPFLPERVDAYEFGMKNKWDKAVLNIAIFHSKFKDLQTAVSILNATGGTTNVVNNAGVAVSQGVEIDGQWKVNSQFRLSANATYLDSHYDSFLNSPPTELQKLAGAKNQDLSGRPTPYAPRWSGSVTGAYSMSPQGGYRMTAELSPTYSTSYYANPLIDELYRQDAYLRLDGRLSLETPSGRWAFDLIGKNLNNRTIVIYGITQGTVYNEQKVQPRSVAVQARYNY